MRASRWAATGIAGLLLVGACSAASSTAPRVTEPDDPAEVLAGRGVKGLGGGGSDVVMRVDAEGFRLPEGEVLLDVHGDRVLSGRKGSEGQTVRLILRDLDGNAIREIDSGIEIPQTAIVRGDDVYFGGIDALDTADGLEVTDRGAWVARGDDPPELVLAAGQEDVRHTAIEASPDGRSVAISRCGEIACTTTLIGPEGASVEVPKAGLVALTNEVALLIGQFSEVTAYAVTDGAELWRADTDGVYYERYATSDGARIVISSVEDAGDGDENSTDQLRLEVLDGRTGTVESTVLVSTEHVLWWVAPSLSSDRYVALLESILPNADEGPHAVHVVDLDAGRLLDLEVTLGAVP